MSKEEHNSLHSLERKRLYAIIKCKNCGSIFIREASKVIYKTNSTGMYFCSKECYKIYISQKRIIQKCEEGNKKSSIIDIGYLSKKEYLDRLGNNDYSPIENHSKETSGIQKEILVDEEIKQMIKHSSKSKKACKCCGRILKNNSDLCAECYRRRQNEIVVDKIMENRDKIANMALEHKTVKEISESLGLIPQSFSRACRRLGIKYKI